MKMKRISSVILAAILVLALAVPAFAMGPSYPGSITINDSADGTDSSVRQYFAYQILEVTLAADNSPAYQVPAGMLAFYGDKFHGDATYYNGMTDAAINADVVAEIAALTSNSAMQAFSEAALTAAKTAYAAGQLTGISIDGDNQTAVPYGYYVIEDLSTASEVAQVSAVMVNTTTPDAEIALKANTPGIVKAIVTNEGDKTFTNGAIGDTVNYKITGTVPDMTDFDSYIYNVSDTLSAGLTMDYTSIVVKLDKGTGLETLTAGTDYTVANNGQEFTIAFINMKQYNAYAGNGIEITYSATINSSAVVGVEGNPNAASLIYSNDPKNDELTGETPDEKTYTYVTGLHLLKKDGGEGGLALVGAEFTLKGTRVHNVVVIRDTFTADPSASPAYYQLITGAYTTTAPSGASDPNYVDDTIYAKTENTSTETLTSAYEVTATVGEDGLLYFDGLGSGDYTLTEITAPNGYNILVDPIDVDIAWAAPLDPTTSTDCTWTCLIGGVDQATSGVVSIVVNNIKGTELPSTGGIGTTIFTIVGIALIVGAGLLLILRRKPAKKAAK